MADGSWNMTEGSWAKGEASCWGQEGAWDTTEATWPIEDASNWGAPEAGWSATDPNWTPATANWGATETSSTLDGQYDQCSGVACDSSWSRYKGVVKSFNSTSGYGFIMAEGLDRDVYLSKRELPAEMQQTRLEKGTEVTFELRVREDGKPQACAVQFPWCGPQETSHSPVALPGPTVVADHSRLPHGVLLHGTVRSYSPRHGYGFLYLGAAHKSQDLFFAKGDLPWDCQESSLVGEPFSFEVTYGSSGKQQATTMLWLGCIPEGKALAESCMPHLEARKSTASGGNATRLPPVPATNSSSTTTLSQPPTSMTYATTPTGTTNNELEHRFTGTLRSYSAQGGFGFIVCPAIGVDVWFAKHELPTEYQEQTINELRGCTVTFVLRSSKEGKRQGRQIEVVMQPTAAVTPPSSVTPAPPPSIRNNSMPGAFAMSSGEKSGRLLGNIKGYGDDYGVIASGQVNGDISFHRYDFHSSLVDGVATLENGQPVLFRLEYAPDGSPHAKDVVLVPMAEERMFGTVKTYIVNSGYGFIEPMQGSPFVLDLYFHRDDVPEALQVCNLAGCQVSFLLKLANECEPQAKDILFLSSPSEAGRQDGEPTGVDDGNYLGPNLQPAEGGACKRPLEGSSEADGMPPSKRFTSDQKVPEDSVGMAGITGITNPAVPAADMSAVQTGQPMSVPPPPPPPRAA